MTPSIEAPEQILYTIGYGGYPTKKRLQKLLNTLTAAGIELLIDSRHSPCSSNPNPGGNYGPKEWNLQTEGGLAHHLDESGMAYLWLVELGNPQKNDPAMAVLKQHIASQDTRWPVNRGLALLQEVLESGVKACLLCACKDHQTCHRTVVAQAMQERYPAALKLHHL